MGKTKNDMLTVIQSHYKILTKILIRLFYMCINRFWISSTFDNINTRNSTMIKSGYI